MPRVVVKRSRAELIRKVETGKAELARSSPFPSGFSSRGTQKKKENRGTKGDVTNFCGKMPSLRKAGLPGSCSLAEQLQRFTLGLHADLRLRPEKPGFVSMGCAQSEGKPL
jgi:hypothetical protein